MAKQKNSPEAIRAQIEQMQERLAEAERAERDRKVRELTDLVTRGGALDEALEWAHVNVATKRKRSRKPARIADASDVEVDL